MSYDLVKLVAQASFVLGCMCIAMPYVMELLDLLKEEKDGEHDRGAD